MSYKNEESERMNELCRVIEDRVEEAYPHMYSYLDVPALTEMLDIIAAHETDTDHDAVEDSECYLRYVAKVYRKMGHRAALAARYYTKMLSFSEALGKQYYDDDEECRDQLAEDLYYAVYTRVFYAPDNCADIISIGSKLLSDEEMEEIYAKASKAEHLTYDPVEATEIFLEAIDGADRYADENAEFKGRGSARHIWGLMQTYLKKHGVKWKTPGQMNPGKRID